MPKNDKTKNQSRFAIVRWLDKDGRAHVAVFGPAGTALKRGTEIPDLLDLETYSGHSFFQVRIVRRALIQIGAALKGVPSA
jgi:hypothetical protein